MMTLRTTRPIRRKCHACTLSCLSGVLGDYGPHGATIGGIVEALGKRYNLQFRSRSVGGFLDFLVKLGYAKELPRFEGLRRFATTIAGVHELGRIVADDMSKEAHLRLLEAKK